MGTPMASAGWQCDMVHRLEALLRRRPTVRGLVLFGSVAAGTADQWSDVDALIVVKEGCARRLHTSSLWLKPLGDVYTCSHTSDSVSALSRYVFTDLRRLDLVIAAESALPALADGSHPAFWGAPRVIFSRSPAVYQAFERPLPQPPVPTVPVDVLSRESRDFWFLGVQAVEKVLRGDLLIAFDLGMELEKRCVRMLMRLRDRAEGTFCHRYAESWNRVLADLRLDGLPCTSDAMLERVERAAVVYDELMTQWSDAHVEGRGPLLAWIRTVREALK